MGGQRGLDVAELDAEAADLDLGVAAAAVFEVAVGQLASEVAGAVAAQRRAVRCGEGDEPLGGQVGAAEVAEGDAGSGDDDLAGLPVGDGGEVLVQELDAEVRQRAADEAAVLLQVGGLHTAVGSVHGDLGDAVHVDELGRGVAVLVDPGREVGEPEGLAAEDHGAYGQPVLVAALLGDQLAEGGGGLAEHGDPLVAQQGAEAGGVLGDVPGDDHDGAAVQDGAPDFPDGEVEGEGVEHRPDVVGPEAEERLGLGEQAHDVAVGDLDALGAAGGSRGEDDVRPGVRGDRHGPQGRGRRLLRGAVEDEDVLPGGERGCQPGGGEDERGRRVLQDGGQAGCRGSRVERHVGRAGLQGREGGHHHVAGALQEDRERPGGLVGPRLDPCREVRRRGFEFLVSQPVRTALDCDAFRMALGGRQEGTHQSRFGRMVGSTVRHAQIPRFREGCDVRPHSTESDRRNRTDGENIRSLARSCQSIA
nr:hypothetical protein [Streptomyces sp. 2231.1]